MTGRPPLSGVARVRGARERDSRVGLVEALAEERRAAARVADLTDRLASVGVFAGGDLVAFRARQARVTGLTEALATARRTLDDARILTLAARDRWGADRTRLAAVESLIERRREAASREERRHEARRLDEVAGELWLRRQGSTSPLTTEVGP